MGVPSSGNTVDAQVGGVTKLVEAVTKVTTGVITVENTSEFPESGTICVGKEYMTYSGKTVTTFVGIQRAQFFLSDPSHGAAAHDVGAEVRGAFVGVAERNFQPDVMYDCVSDTKGRVFLDFSNNNVDWNTFPPKGVLVLPGVVASRKAAKGPRWFRVRFETLGAEQSRLKFYTYYGQHTQSVLPLDEPLDDDADSIVVRSVIVGQDPRGRFVNQKQGGYVFSVEKVDDLPFDSGILDISGYSQIQLEVYSDAPGITSGIWYSDAAMTQVIRKFELPFSAGSDGTYQLVNSSAPAYTRFLKVTYVSSGTPTQIMLRFKVLTKPISGQVMGVADFIAPNMACNLQRSIVVGAQPDGGFVNLPADGSALNFENVGALAKLKDGLRRGVVGVVKLAASTAKADWSPQTHSGKESFLVIDQEIMAYKYTAMADPAGDEIIITRRGLFKSTETSHAKNSVVRSVANSKWTDTDGWNTIELFIASDQASCQRGVIVQFTNDARADTPVARYTRRFSFTRYDAAQGARVFRFQTLLDGFRVLYAPGPVLETDFYMDATLKVASRDKHSHESLPISIRNHFQDRYARKKSVLGYRSSFPEARVMTDICMFPIDKISTTYQMYTPAATTYGVEVVSTHSEDSAGKSGVRKVGIVYLDADWAEQYIEVDLNGKTPVTAVPENVFRVNDMFSVSVGGTGAAVGNITCRTTSDSVLESDVSTRPKSPKSPQRSPRNSRFSSGKQCLRLISKGTNRDITGLYTVPAHHTAYADAMTVSSAGGTQDARLRANVDPRTRARISANCFLVQSILYVGSARNNTKTLPSLKFPAKTDIKFSSNTNSKSGDISVSLSLTLIEDL
jgi:hypothetical protein